MIPKLYYKDKLPGLLGLDYPVTDSGGWGQLLVGVWLTVRIVVRCN